MKRLRWFIGNGRGDTGILVLIGFILGFIFTLIFLLILNPNPKF